MDENQQTLNTTVAQPEPESSTEQEAPKTEPVETAEVNSTENTEPEETTESKESAKSANARIRELNAKAHAAEEKARSLAEKLAEYTGSVDSSSQEQPYVPQIEPGSEVSPDQYKADVMRTAQAITQIEIARQKNLDRIDKEASEVTKTYAQLDPNSVEFDKELSDSIYLATMSHLRVDQGASVKKFVDSLMKPYLRSVSKASGEAQSEMAKQVTQAALRPTAVKAKEKTIEEMSIKELGDKIGFVH